MALPIKKFLKENVDSDFKNEVEKLIEFLEFNLNYEFQELPDKYNLLGSGSDALVFEVPNTNKVIRISDSVYDKKNFYDIYNKLLNKNFDHVVRVYMNKKLQTYTDRVIYLQVMEKLEPIDKYLSQVLDFLEQEIGFGGKLYFDYHELLALEDNFYDDLMEVEDIILDVQEGLNELESVDIYHADLWHQNIMKDPKTGNYKIVDIS